MSRPKLLPPLDDGALSEGGAESLQAVIDQVDTAAIGEPAFRLVITGTGPTLVTDDGTVNAPLAALAP
ncbi:MAG: hypothetical protein QM714_13090 [Nocardioides sp.]|uniref:hypothetical protein n=1 Tax=Nocardioides sp. TaxID=35761 RepID=UPI0039E41C5A